MVQLAGVLYLNSTHTSESIEMPCDALLNWKSFKKSRLTCDVPANLNMRTLMKIFDGQALLNAIELPGNPINVILDAVVRDFDCEEREPRDRKSTGKFKSCSITVSVPTMQIGDALRLTGPEPPPSPRDSMNVVVRLEYPFTRQQKLTYFMVEGKVEFPALSGYAVYWWHVWVSSPCLGNDV